MFLNKFNFVKSQPEVKHSAILKSAKHEAVVISLAAERKSSKVAFGGGARQLSNFQAIEQAGRLCMSVLAQALRDLRCPKESIRKDAYGWIMAGVDKPAKNGKKDYIAMKGPKGREVPVSNSIFTLNYCCEIINLRFAAIGYDITVDPVEFRKRVLDEVEENRNDILNCIAREFDNAELDISPYYIYGMGELYARAA